MRNEEGRRVVVIAATQQRFREYCRQKHLPPSGPQAPYYMSKEYLLRGMDLEGVHFVILGGWWTSWSSYQHAMYFNQYLKMFLHHGSTREVYYT